MTVIFFLFEFISVLSYVLRFEKAIACSDSISSGTGGTPLLFRFSLSSSFDFSFLLVAELTCG